MSQKKVTSINMIFLICIAHRRAVELRPLRYIFLAGRTPPPPRPLGRGGGGGPCASRQASSSAPEAARGQGGGRRAEQGSNDLKLAVVVVRLTSPSSTSVGSAPDLAVVHLARGYAVATSSSSSGVCWEPAVGWYRGGEGATPTLDLPVRKFAGPGSVGEEVAALRVEVAGGGGGGAAVGRGRRWGRRERLG
jgi:hypothetical protein